MAEPIPAPLAVLLCHFSDDLVAPYERSRYEDIFTSVDEGKWSIPDYFRDMSHGRLDLSGSRVFGWLTLDKETSEYAGSGANQAGRQDLLTWARAAAGAADIDLSPFRSVVVVMNYARDLFGGGNGAACGDDGKRLGVSGLAPSLLGQEVGHIFGLNHSRIEPAMDTDGDGEIGPGVDYTDPFDVMSTDNARSTAHPYLTERTVTAGAPVFTIGPGINAANMDHAGWLDPERVLRITPSGSGQRLVELRPLHRHDLPGHLLVRYGDLYIEFRDGLRWDAGFGAGVQVRRLEDGISYLQSNWAGGQNSGAGDSYGTTEALSVRGSHVRIHVQSVDAANGVATVLLSWQKPRFDVPVEVLTGPHRDPWVTWGGLHIPHELVIPTTFEVEGG